MKILRYSLTALFIALTAFTFTTTARAATEATFSVNSTADQIDKNPGDGICATKKNKCTLRAAIMEHNARGGKNKITLPAKEFKLTITGNAEDKAKKGDLDITKGKLTIQGAGFPTLINAQNLDRVFDVVGGSLTIRDLSFGFGGNINEHGAGIRVQAAGKLTLVNTLVAVNATRPTFSGGGMANFGTTTVKNSIFQNNYSALNGGAIYNQGTLVLQDSTVRDNIANMTGGAVFNEGTFIARGSLVDSNSTKTDYGGGISNGGTATLVNSTISRNAVDTENFPGNNRGGGIFNAKTMTLANVTIAENYGGSGAGIYTGLNSTTNFKHTLMTGNYYIFEGNTVLNDCSGDLNSLGYNLISVRPNNCTFTQNADGWGTTVSPFEMYILPLADNDGPTETYALTLDSPALDGGDFNGCTDENSAPLTTDQRGSARPTDGDGMNGARCDIGAFEK